MSEPLSGPDPDKTQTRAAAPAGENSPSAKAGPAPRRFRVRFVAVSWRDLAVSFGPAVLLGIAAIWLAVWLINPAPPTTITIASGPVGSTFYVTAQKYQSILARNAIHVIIETTEGSLDNLRRLGDAHTQTDVGFVQGGLADKAQTAGLVSLGSVFYVPMAVFYRTRKPLDRLSALAGKRLAIGPEGSGTRQLALTLLKGNGIEAGGPTQLEALGGDEAARALSQGSIDAAFLMGDSATPPTMRQLMRAPGIRLLDFAQAQAYTRRYTYLNSLELPMGVFDLAANLPPETLHLVAPTAELIARESLHPALSDLLIEAAREVHGKATVLQHAGEFPAPLAHEFRISDDASRYYKSGKSFLYRVLPFWLASLADRVLVIVVPLVVLLIPTLRLVPSLYRWRIKSRIYKWYGALIAIERSMLDDGLPTQRPELLRRLDRIEDAVNRMKMPLAFADQFYVLREHIGFVRGRLTASAGPLPCV